jgi:hypothetical protein
MPALLIRAGLVILIAGAAVGTPADADLWGHLTFGGDIVSSGAVVQADRYSFTSDRPWLNHEWLSEVVFYQAYRLGGPAGLVAFKVAVIAALLALVGWHAARATRPMLSAHWIVALAFAGTYWRTHTVRPQLFSVLFFAALLIAMTRFEDGRRRALYLVPPLMALWVNLHGGWIVGLGVFGLWAATRPSTFSILVVLASILATLLNPFGAEMWSFLAETVRLGRADIEEWGSILTYPALLGIPWALSLGVAVWAVWRSPRGWSRLLIPAALGVLSFKVSRLDAFFALAVVMLLGNMTSGVISQKREKTPDVIFSGRQRLAFLLVTGLALLAMMVPAWRVVAPHVTCLPIGGPWAPDPEAARFVLANQLRGRVVTWFDWGEYAIWHFGPALQVSMDGRRETVYSDSMIQAHRRFYAADDTALPFLSTLDADYVWVPVRLPIADRLPAAGWTPAFRGATSAVFARSGAGPFLSAPAAPVGRRCFPGP